MPDVTEGINNSWYQSGRSLSAMVPGSLPLNRSETLVFIL